MAGKGNSNDVNLRRPENGNKDDHKEEGSRAWECGNVGGRDSCRETSEDLMPLHIEVRGSGREAHMPPRPGLKQMDRPPSMYRLLVDAGPCLL